MTNIEHKTKLDKHVQRDLFRLAELFALMRDEDYEHTIEQALNLIKEHVSADRVYVCIYDQIQQATKPTYVAETDHREWVPGLKDVSFADLRPIYDDHQKCKSVCLKDTFSSVGSDRLNVLLRLRKVRGLLAEPLFHDDRLYGCLVLERTKTPMSCNNKTRRAIGDFTRILSAAIRRIRFHDATDLKQLIDAAGVGTWQWDLETDHTVFNDKWAEMLGYSLDELDPVNLDTWKNMTHPSDLEHAMRAFESVLEGEKDVYQAEFRMKHKERGHVWIKDIGRIVKRRDGKPKAMAGVHVDITEQKEKELYYEAITKAIDHSPVAIVITDTKGTIEYVNPMFTTTTGYTYEEAIGNNPRILKSGYHDDDYYASIWETIIEGREWKGELYNKRKDGSLYWESASITPVYDDDDVIRHFVAVKQDITGQKAEEREMNLYRRQLESEIRMKMAEVDNSHKAAIIALAKLTEARDVDTGLHVERVQHLSKALAASLRENPEYADRIDHDFLEDLFYAAALHDLGKVSISDDILLKPGKLNEKEFEVIKSHVKTGSDLLQEMLRHYAKNPIIKMGKQIARYHHERWNGSGYLEGLTGKDIPLEARIVALVDVYDALRSKRPYKEPYAHDKCHRIILEESGKHFDPDVVEAYVRASAMFEEIYDSLL